MLISSVMMLFFVLFFWRTFRNRAPNKLVDFACFILSLKIVIYYIVPSVLRLFSGGKYILDERVDIVDVAIVYSIESVSLFVFIFSLSLFFLLNNKLKNRKYNDYLEDIPKERVILYIISIGFIITRLDSIIGFDIGFLGIFKPLFYSAGLLSGSILIVGYFCFHRKLDFLLGFTTSIFSVLSISTRGAFVYTILTTAFLVFYLIENRKTKSVIMFCSILVLAVFLFIGGAVKTGFYITEDGTISIEATTNENKSMGRNLIDEMEWRFGALTRYSTAFIDMYVNGESAGLNPIINTAQGFLPRSVLPEKPIPNTTVANDIYSQGMYLLMYKITGVRTNMVEFSTGTHFYWELGWFGVFFFSFLSALYVFSMGMFYSRFNLLFFPMFASMTKPWGFMDVKIWISDAILQFYQIFLPFLFLLSVVSVSFTLMRCMRESFSKRGRR